MTGQSPFQKTIGVLALTHFPSWCQLPALDVVGPDLHLLQKMEMIQMQEGGGRPGWYYHSCMEPTSQPSLRLPLVLPSTGPQHNPEVFSTGQSPVLLLFGKDQFCD